MAFDLCVIPASVVPYLSALQTRKFSITDITAHLVSEKLTREQCRLITPDTFTSSYGSSSHALHVRSSVSSEINLAITSSVSGNAPSGHTIVIQGYLNDRNIHIVLGVCVSDEPIVADASLRLFVNIEETNNVFRLRADFDGMVTQGLLDDILYQSVHNATLTIKKSANVSGDTFTANASSDKTIDLDLGDAADKNVDTSIVNASSGNLPTVEAVTGWVSSQLNGYAQAGDIPTVGNATITIQKRSGTSAGDFTTNATSDKTINLSLGAAADKEVDTSISSTSSTNLPTSSAVAEWVNAQIGNFVTLDTQQTITSPKMLSSGESRTSLNISNIVVEQVPSSTSGHTSSATLTSDGLYADGVSFKNAYGRAADNLDNLLVASVSGNRGYSELAVLGGNEFTFSYKGTDETVSHYPLRISAGSTTFDKNQTLYLAQDTNTYLHVDNTPLSVKDYVERVVGSGSSKFVVADVNTPYPSGDNFKDKRPSVTSSTSGTSSDNPHYNSKNASFMFDVSELPSNGTTFEVFMPSTTFVGSVQLVYGSLNYIYPIYFRGNDNVHCPTVPQGSVLRITFYNDAFYGDFYDLADFGDEHEAYVYVGKVPVDKSGSDLYAFSGLVGIDRDTGKFSQLFNVSVTDNGAWVISPRLKENSPIYACFQGDCFAAHPKVPFGNILRIHDVYGQGTLSTNMLPFTYYPFDAGDTVDAHVVTNTSSQGSYKYFQVDNCPVYIQVESNRVLLGNPPADIPARLIGFMCSGAENAGMIRLVESADVSYMSDNEYSKTFAGVWDDNSVDLGNYNLSHVVTSLSYLSDNVLVGLSKNSSKLVPLLVDDACKGDVTINPNLDWDSPVYVLFKNFRCFSAHPMVDFRQILKYENGSFLFTFSPMGSEAPSVAGGDDGNQYFGSANYPVFISDFCGSYAGYKSFCVGVPSDVNIPSSDLHWRLLGYTTSKPGYIRLTESHPLLKDFIHQTGGYVKLSKFTDTFYDSSIGDYVTPSQYVEHIQKTKPEYDINKVVQELVSNHGESVFHIKDLNASSVSASLLNGEVYVGLPSMTTVEFKDRVSFRTSADEVAYIDRDGVYHGKATSAGYLRYHSTNVLSVESESVVTSNATVRPASSNSSLNLGTSTYKWGSVYATSLGDLFYPLTSSYSTSLYCTNVYSSGSSAVQCFTLGTNPSYANDISISGTDSDGSRGYLHPSVLHGADLGSFSKCFNKVWTKDIQAYGTISGDLDGTATRATQATKATQDGSGNIIISTYLRDISVDRFSKSFFTYTTAGIQSSVQGFSYNTALTLKTGDTSTRLVSLTDLVANIIAGTGTGTTVGNVRWVCCKTTGKWSKKDENIYMSGANLYPVDMTTSASDAECAIRFNATTSLGNSALIGVWRLLSYVGAISNGNMLVALAVRVF